MRVGDFTSPIDGSPLHLAVGHKHCAIKLRLHSFKLVEDDAHEQVDAKEGTDDDKGVEVENKVFPGLRHWTDSS